MSGCITMSNEKQPEKPTIQFPCEDYHISVVADTHDGFVTILEEIVGEFTSDFAANMPEILPQEDGSYVIDGMAVLRDINRALRWNLPTIGPKTLSGFVLEHLETIPETNVCLWVDEYQIETLQIKDNIVKTLSIRQKSKGRSGSESPEDPRETAQQVV